MIASFDGACEPYNPGGHMGLGWVIDGQPYCESIPAASENTSNVAEYLALTRVLQFAISAGPATLTITGDSRLIITQLNGQYAVRPHSLDGHHLVAARLLYQIRQGKCTVDLIWIPRGQNVTPIRSAMMPWPKKVSNPRAANQNLGGQLDWDKCQESLE